MIGDAYFQLRAQIGTSLYSLASLAREVAAPAGVLDALQALQARVREPFVFAAFGERGAGKSSLLNALFERDFASDPAYAGRVVTYRYGASSREETRPDGSLEIQRPSVFLRDFTLIELPAPAGAEALPASLAATDLILAVLSATSDPEAAGRMLASLDAAALGRCVCVIQQSDALEMQDLQTFVDRLRLLLPGGGAHELPMFAVSAHTRYGLHKLERHIEREIIVAAARCQSLREICTAGRAALSELGAHVEENQQSAEQRRQRIDEAQTALAGRRDQSLRLAADALWGLTRLFDSAQSRTDKMLRRRLTLPGLWRDRGEWWRAFHSELETGLRESIARNLTATFEKFEADLHAAWTQHRDALKRLRLEPCPPFSHDAQALFARLTADLVACDPDGAATRVMQRTYARARRHVRLPAFAALAALAILGAAFFAGRSVVAAAALTIVAAIALLVVLVVARRHVLAALRRLMDGRRERVLSFFEQEVRSEIERFYGVLAVSFTAPASRREDPSATVGSARAQVRQLEEVFERCAAQIAAIERPGA